MGRWGKGGARATGGAGGFTLIELLIVIAIIGIMAAIAIPALLGAKDRAVNAAVESNVDTIFTFLAVYDTDNQLLGQPDAVAWVTSGISPGGVFRQIQNPFTKAFLAPPGTGASPNRIVVNTDLTPPANGGTNFGEIFVGTDTTVGQYRVWGVTRQLTLQVGTVVGGKSNR